MATSRTVARARPHRPDDAGGGPAQATVKRVTGEGLMVTLDRQPGTFLRGPCAWSRPPGAGDPPAGTRCFVTKADTNRWVVVNFDGWPA